MSRSTAKTSSLTSRIIAFSSVGIVVLMLISGGAITWAFNQSVQRSLNNYLSAYLDVLAAATTLNYKGNVVVRTNTQVLENIPRYWQITSTSKRLKKSPLLQNWIEVDHHLDPGIAHRIKFIEEDGTHVTAVQKTLIFPGNKRVTYLFGVQEEIAKEFARQESQAFLNVLVVVLAVMAGLLLVFVVVQIRFTISPLAKIRHSLEQIRSGKNTRLDDNFPKEIQLLADEVNTLVDYSSGVVNRYRTFAGNLAHALKTPLSVLRNEATKENSTLGQTVKDKGDVMLALIDRNLARVKAAGTANLLGARSEIFPIAEKIARSFGKLYGKQVNVSGDKKAIFRGEEGDFYEILGNIVENACKHAQSKAHIYISGKHTLEIAIDDDGKGIPPEEREKVLERGTRLDETVPGTGIGLSITQDLVKLYGGDIALSGAEIGGLRVVITLPRAS